MTLTVTTCLQDYERLLEEYLAEEKAIAAMEADIKV